MRGGLARERQGHEPVNLHDGNLALSSRQGEAQPLVSSQQWAGRKQIENLRQAIIAKGFRRPGSLLGRRRFSRAQKLDGSSHIAAQPIEHGEIVGRGNAKGLGSGPPLGVFRQEAPKKRFFTDLREDPDPH